MKMKPVLLAPAGDFESLMAALNNGADAVYFGVGNLNMRSRATVNFTKEDLPEVVRRCRRAKAKAWLTLNTIIYDNELEEVKALCDAAKDAGIDAVIASDFSVITTARAIGLNVHLSVQANICNMETVRFFSQFADVVVLARELSLEQIKHICSSIKSENIKGPSGKLLKVEVFVHGALCVAISGKCYMSIATFNASANRGACMQNCRKAYTVKEARTGYELEIDGHHIMSPKDICTAGVLDQILDSGVSILKIEGRGRSADYVAATVSVYREAVERWQAGKPFTKAQSEKWTRRLSEVFNRGFWQGGYYLGNKLGEWSETGDSQAVLKKVHIGDVVRYYPKIKVAEVNLSAGELRRGDRILITGTKTGAIEHAISELRIEQDIVDSAPKGSTPTFVIDTRLREGDKLYRLDPR